MSTSAPPEPRLPGDAYGAQFARFYDRLFPRAPGLDQTVERLASLHRPEAGRALELGAGTGRVALPLSARTGAVLGVDASAEMLEQLAANATTAGAPVQAREGDLRDFDGEGERFGLVYCVLGTISILLTPDEQREALAVLARAAAPGAAIVIETHNPDWVRRSFTPGQLDMRLIPYPEPDTGLLTQSFIDPASGIWQLAHVFYDHGRAHVASELSRLTTADELDDHARAAGLEPVARHGGWAGEPADERAPMVVCTYRRPQS